MFGMHRILAVASLSRSQSATGDEQPLPLNLRTSNRFGRALPTLQLASMETRPPERVSLLYSTDCMADDAFSANHRYSTDDRMSVVWPIRAQAFQKKGAMISYEYPRLWY